MNCASEDGDSFIIEVKESELNVSMIGGSSTGGGGGDARSPPDAVVPAPLARVAVDEAEESAEADPI